MLVIENEGPQEPYRRKLERRRANWEHDLGDRLHVNVANWASFRLDTADDAQRLNEECERLQIELVLADPLDSLGMEGEGSPSEVRAMVDLMKQAGFGTRSGWLVVHHPGKTQHADLVDQASGAWGPKPDLMLLLEKLDGNRARLSFPKTRWATAERPPVILAFVPDTEAFAFVAEEGGEERDLFAEVKKFLAANPLRIVKEIAAPKNADPPGIGASESAIRKVLKDNPDEFDMVTGEDALAAGRESSRAQLWLQSSGSNSVDSVGEFLGEGDNRVAPLPVRGGELCPTPAAPTTDLKAELRPHPAGVDDPVADADRIAAKYKRPDRKDGT